MLTSTLCEFTTRESLPINYKLYESAFIKLQRKRGVREDNFSKDPSSVLGPSEPTLWVFIPGTCPLGLLTAALPPVVVCG